MHSRNSSFIIPLPPLHPFRFFSFKPFKIPLLRPYTLYFPIPPPFFFNVFTETECFKWWEGISSFCILYLVILNFNGTVSVISSDPPWVRYPYLWFYKLIFNRGYSTSCDMRISTVQHQENIIKRIIRIKWFSFQKNDNIFHIIDQSKKGLKGIVVNRTS